MQINMHENKIMNFTDAFVTLLGFYRMDNGIPENVVLTDDERRDFMAKVMKKLNSVEGVYRI
jgi:hypothetical protein